MTLKYSRIFSRYKRILVSLCKIFIILYYVVYSYSDNKNLDWNKYSKDTFLYSNIQGTK